MDIREIGLPERSALDLSSAAHGYVIPYYDIQGFPTPFYRVRLDTPSKHKYKQPKNTSNAVYYPKNFLSTLNGHKYVIFTEGEKKAVAANKIGCPTIAFGGVYSWKNNVFKLPSDAIVQGKAGTDVAIIPKTNITIRLQEDFDPDRMFNMYATGFDALVDLVKTHELTVLIAYDSSAKGSKSNNITLDVQRAAAKLGMELRSLGIKMGRIKQLLLPLGTHEKMGVDDYIQLHGISAFKKLVEDSCNNARGFPHHPDLRTHIAKKLQFPKITRKEMMQLGLSMVAQLDFRGRRLKAVPDGDMYYFDGVTKELFRMSHLQGGSGNAPVMHDKFTNLLYDEFDLTGADQRVIKVVNTQSCCEGPIDEVVPRKGLHIDSAKDTVYFQISSKEFVSVSAAGINIHDNGTNNIMFEGLQYSNELDGAHLLTELKKQIDNDLEPWWFDTLRQTRLDDNKETLHRTKLATVLFYASPWLHRWKGTQLPIEIATGEAGSGKSTLYGLRLEMLTGRQDLRNRPKNIADWYASIIGTGGLHVVDNANLEADPALGQLMSDEMCRMITEPKPTVEMRRYYTEKELMRVPVNAVFAMTALRLPFRQLDLIQRSVHFSLSRGTGASAYLFDADWADNQLNIKGGRVGWVAHHLIVLHKFLKLAEKRWQPKYKAKFRLINLEQILMLMCDLFGWDNKWIPDHLSKSVQESSAEVDWILQGLIAYKDDVMARLGENASSMTISPGMIATWASGHEDFATCQPLTDARRLSNYMIQHPSMIGSVAKIVPVSTGANERASYRIIP
jgi:hypothetical protein